MSNTLQMKIFKNHKKKIYLRINLPGKGNYIVKAVDQPFKKLA